MPLDLPTSFIESSNKKKLQPITLFRISVTDDPSEDIFMAARNRAVDFYKTDNGIHTAQTYAASSIEEDKIKYSSTGENPTVSVSIADASRIITAHCESSNGLRGKRVVIRKVFADKLSNPEDYKEDTFFVENCEYSSNYFVKFNLATKLSAYNIPLPFEVYAAECSPKVHYKGRRCWISNGDGTYSKPEGFSEKEYVLLNKEEAVTTNLVNIQLAFNSKNLVGFNKVTDKFVVFIKTSSLTAIAGVPLTISIAVSGDLTNSFNFTIPNLSSYLILSDTYAKLTLDMSDFSVAGSGPDTSKIGFVKFLSGTMASSAVISIKDPAIDIIRPYKYMLDNDNCAKTLNDCRRHNNTKRFGGFPGVPKSTYQG